MQERVFKVVMAHLESSLDKIAVSSKDIKDVQFLISLLKGENKNNPKIKNTAQFYEAANNLGISKQELPKILSGIMQEADSLNLPTGLLGDVGEYLGEKKGIGLIPTSLLERTFLTYGLSKYVGHGQWQYFFKSENKLKNLKKEKGV